MSWQAQTPGWVLNLSIFKNIIINQCEMECSQQPKMPRKVFNQRESWWARLALILCLDFWDQKQSQKSSRRAGRYLSFATRHLPVSWGSPRGLVGTITANSPWCNRKRGLGMRMDKPSLWHFVWFLDWDDRDHLLRTIYCQWFLTGVNLP